MAKLSVSSKHRAKLAIDGTEVTLLVGRMEMTEFIEFETKYFEYGRPERGSDESVELLGVEARARLLARSREILDWVEATIREWASFPAGEVEIDERPVVTGEDIVKTFGARQLLMMQIINLVWASNRLPESIKKNLSPLSDFPDGSAVLGLEVAGQIQEQTATDADVAGFAVIADATPAPSPETKPSGETIA